MAEDEVEEFDDDRDDDDGDDEGMLKPSKLTPTGKLVDEATALGEEAVEAMFRAVQKIRLAQGTDPEEAERLTLQTGAVAEEGVVYLYPSGPSDLGTFVIDFNENVAELRFWHIDNESWELFHTLGADNVDDGEGS